MSRYLLALSAASMVVNINAATSPSSAVLGSQAAIIYATPGEVLRKASANNTISGDEREPACIR